MTDVKHFAETPSLTSDQIDYILLDGSSSMHGQWYDVLNSLDTYVEEVRRQPGIQSQVLLATFSTRNVHQLERDCPVGEWLALRDAPIDCPGGMTPLYDAIVQMGLMLREINPPRASIIIATDGNENGSLHDEIVARGVLDWMKAKGWQVSFIGCNWNNSELAAKLGVSPEASIGVGRRHLTDATRELGKKRNKYGISGAPIHWSEDEKQNFGGYLGG